MHRTDVAQEGGGATCGSAKLAPCAWSCSPTCYRVRTEDNVTAEGHASVQRHDKPV